MLSVKKLVAIFFLLSFLESGSQVPTYVPTGGLMGYWPFTGNANDVSGNGNNGTVNGAVLTPDRFLNANSAYSFNVSNYISTTYTGILGSNARAVSFWMASTTSTTGMSAVAWGDNQFAPNAGTRYDCGFNYMATGPTIDGADAAMTYSPNGNIFNNTWHHFVFQFSNSTLNQVQIYQDGVLLTQVLHSFMPNTNLHTVNNFDVLFGRVNYPPAPGYFIGQLDDIGIWNRTLTLCEIQNLYTSSLHGILTVVSSATAICKGDSAILTASGGGIYTWGSIVGGSSVIVFPTVTTVYTAVATGTGTGCGTLSQTVSVIVNPTPTLSISSSQNPLCFGSSATLSASGANTYTWLGIGTGSSIVVNPLNITTYTLIGSNGTCSSSLTITQNISPLPSFNISSSDTVICAGVPVNLIATGASSYTWQPGNLVGATVSVAPSSTTVYTVTGATALGCTVSALWSIIVTPSITISAFANPTIVCPGNSTTLTASGATSYTWFPGNLTGSVVVVNPISPTTYIVLGENGACSASTTVNVNIGLNVNISSSGNLCNNNTVNLFVTPAFLNSTILWIGPGIIGTNNSSSITVNVGGIYSVTVNNTLTGCSGATTFNVISNLSPLSLNIVPSSTFACFPGAPVNFLVSASANLNWFPPSEVTPSTGPLVSVSPTVTTTYTLIGTLGSCSGTSAITISVNITPTITAVSTSPSVCPGIVSTLTATGAADYNWFPGNLSGPSVTVNPYFTTNYTLTGSNGNCSSVINLPITVLAAPDLATKVSPATICIGHTATLTATGTPILAWLLGDPPPLSYSAAVNPTVTTTYSVIGTNSLGCSSIATVQLNVINSPALQASTSSTEICAGESVTLTVLGGSTTYTWFPNFLVGPVIIETPTTSAAYTVVSGNAFCSYATVFISVNNCINTSFGLTNAADQPEEYGAEYYRIKITVTANNASNSELHAISLTDDLASTFIYPITYTVVNPPTVISKNSLIIANPLFDGNSEPSLTRPASSTLSANSRDTLVFTVLIDPNGFKGILRNSVVGFATDKNNTVATDSSNNGFAWDPDNDGDPTNNNIITPIEIELIDLFIPEGFSPDDDGRNDLFIIKGMNGRSGKLTIFNRWGNKVYIKEGTELSWDGKANVNALGHDKLPPSTYYYIFEFTEGKSKLFHGFLVMRY